MNPFRPVKVFKESLTQPLVFDIHNASSFQISAGLLRGKKNIKKKKNPSAFVIYVLSLPLHLATMAVQNLFLTAHICDYQESWYKWAPNIVT